MDKAPGIMGRSTADVNAMPSTDHIRLNSLPVCASKVGARGNRADAFTYEPMWFTPASTS